MGTQASNILPIFRECLLSPLVNELEMGRRAELRESYGGGVNCWHFCFYLNWNFSCFAIPSFQCLISLAFALHVTLFAAMFVWIKSHFMYTCRYFIDIVRSCLPYAYFPACCASTKNIHSTVSASVRVIRSTGNITNKNPPPSNNVILSLIHLSMRRAGLPHPYGVP